MNNIMEVKFSAKSENESLARVIVASFAAKLDPTLDELADIKTAVSEAVTNSIIHGYDEDDSKFVYLRCEINKSTIKCLRTRCGSALTLLLIWWSLRNGNERRWAVCPAV